MSRAFSTFLQLKNELAKVPRLEVRAADFDFGTERGDIRIWDSKSKQFGTLILETAGNELRLLLLRPPKVARFGKTAPPESISAFVGRIVAEVDLQVNKQETSRRQRNANRSPEETKKKAGLKRYQKS